MPTRYRDALIAQSEGRITVAPHPAGSLLIYPRNIWELKRNQLLQTRSRELLIKVVGHAEDAELDATGRFLLTAELRGSAGLDRDVRLLGLGDHFELWDETRMNDYFAHPDTARALSEAAAAFPF